MQAASAVPQLILQLGLIPANIQNIECIAELDSGFEVSLTLPVLLYLRVLIAVTLEGPSLLQVTSDLPQVLYLRLQRLDLRGKQKDQRQTASDESLGDSGDGVTSWSMCSLWSFQACRD